MNGFFFKDTFTGAFTENGAADVRISPTGSGRISQPRGIEAFQHFVCRPRRFAARNGGVVFGKLPIVRQPGFMSQQLTQRERTVGYRSIKLDQSITHQ